MEGVTHTFLGIGGRVHQIGLLIYSISLIFSILVQDCKYIFVKVSSTRSMNGTNSSRTVSEMNTVALLAR